MNIDFSGQVVVLAGGTGGLGRAGIIRQRRRNGSLDHGAGAGRMPRPRPPPSRSWIPWQPIARAQECA